MFQLNCEWYLAYSSDKQQEPKMISLNALLQRLSTVEDRVRMQETTKSDDPLMLDSNLVGIAAKIIKILTEADEVKP